MTRGVGAPAPAWAALYLVSYPMPPYGSPRLLADQSMIPKNGTRFSDKIVLKRKI
jgi:hypothetical protein